MTANGISVKERLVMKGVRMPNPDSVEIGPEVDPDRISGQDVTIHTGCKIYGESTLISSETSIGYEGPVLVENCFIGPHVNLKSGGFTGSVFLRGVSLGPGSQVREGTILEEEASIAHTVGLKQTVLFPFVTLGSLINFCDCFMAGGTNRKNHSEVGSSYIHFNFTPNQDKATPSLMGDVPRGVMLNQDPIFLGGQGGLVGPCRFEFGTTIAAGSIWRKDEPRPGRLLFEGRPRGGNIGRTQHVYKSIKRIVMNNLVYIANLKSLMVWYEHVRRLFISEMFSDALHEGLIETLQLNIAERIKQLGALSLKLPDSAEKYRQGTGKPDTALIKQKYELFEKWPEIQAYLEEINISNKDSKMADEFLNTIEKSIQQNGKDYITVIKGLDPEAASSGTQWLQKIVNEIVDGSLMMLPSFS